MKIAALLVALVLVFAPTSASAERVGVVDQDCSANRRDVGAYGRGPYRA